MPIVITTLPNMNLIQPNVLETTGPTWAEDIIESLNLVDAHDHTDDKGVKIPSNAINVTIDLNINNFNLNLVKSIRLNSNESVLSGPKDVNNVFNAEGNLFFSNGNGSRVQLTNGSSLSAAPAGPTTEYEVRTASGELLEIQPTATYSFISVDSTSNLVTIKLPLANSVSAGRFYFIKDSLGTSETNNIIITRNDDSVLSVINVNFTAIQVVSNGVDRWDIYQTAIIDGSITTDKILDENVTLPKIQPATNGNLLRTVSGNTQWATDPSPVQRFTAFSASNWTLRIPANTNSWRGVAYGNGRYVSVSDNGTSRAMYSQDGINWTASSGASQIPNNMWLDVAFGGSYFFAISNSASNNAVLSFNGDNWFSIPGPNKAWTCIAGNPSDRFVALANGGSNRAMYFDGSFWTAITGSNLDLSNWSSVCWGNNQFVAVASSGTNRIATSPDGVAWTIRTPSSGSAVMLGITYGNGLYVIVGTSGFISTSPDGITWTTRTSPSNDSYQGVTYGNSVFVAVSYNNSNRVSYSYDGINWSSTSDCNPSLDINWNATTFGNNKFVAVGNNFGSNNVMTSLDVGLE